MKTLLALFAALSLLSGCAVHTREGSIVIDPPHHDGHYHDGGPGHFCPPGQAKKGNC